MAKLFFALLASLLLSSCASYLAPLCNDGNRRDVHNLEGRFSTVFSFVTKDGSQVQRSQSIVSRVNRGVYLIEGSSGSTRANVCEIDGHLYAEDNKGWNSSLPFSGFLAFQLSPNGDGTFDLVALGVDSKVLDAQHIPYKLIEMPTLTPAPTPTPTPNEKPSPLYSLQVDNRQLTPEQFVQLLDPMSLKLTLQPETGNP